MSLFALSFGVHATNATWQQLQQQAQGQTVWFNAWGGDPAINRYLEWSALQLKTHYAIKLNIVHLADAADAVRRIQSEASAGRKTNGTIDLLWLNGENFHALKRAGLLSEGWVKALPNWRYVDFSKPVEEDFSEPVDGTEAPWGSAQLMLIGDQKRLSNFPANPHALMALAMHNPGKLSYPRPPDFTGTAFIEQLLLTLIDTPQALRHEPDPATFERVTTPLWHYLDQLHPLLWRKGKAFPLTPAKMDRMLADDELLLSMTFNPAHVDNLIARRRLPDSVRAFGFGAGMISNVHFVAIPANARAKAAAMVVANFLMSPKAQIHKADPKIWGDPTILDAQKLPESLRNRLLAQMPRYVIPSPPLAEPHAAWATALEAAWLKRYGSR